MSEKHKLGRIYKIDKNGIDREEVLKTVNDLYTPWSLKETRGLHETLEDSQPFHNIRLDACFTELLDRLTWMWMEGYCNLGVDGRKELVSILMQTIDDWDEWIDKQNAIPSLAERMIGAGLL